MLFSFCFAGGRGSLAFHPCSRGRGVSDVSLVLTGFCFFFFFFFFFFEGLIQLFFFFLVGGLAPFFLA